MILEENLDWNLQLNVLNLKLNKAIGLLCKIRHYVPKFLLKTLYFTIFHSHLHAKFGDKTLIQQIKYKHCKKSSVRVINIRANNYDVRELYKNDKILRISDYIKLLNCLFVGDILTNFSIPPFQN